MTAPDHPPVAYSYVRFSHPEQAKGDSLRRQDDAAAAWCQRNNVRLDTSTTFRDLGKSAYTGAHRANPDRHDLARFLKLVEQGKVPRGSYLIIENLDRLSREHIQPALLLVLNLLQSGVRVVQLSPAELVFDDKSDTLPVMMMMMELSRGHNESEVKSKRVASAWAEKRQRRRNGEMQKATKWVGRERLHLTDALPAWVKEEGGELVPDEPRAAVVRHIFFLARSGYGLGAVVGKLTDDKAPPMGRSDHWTKTYVRSILCDRRALGEYQPRRRSGGKGRKGRVADGPPIAGYYPCVVDEATFLAAQGAALQRKDRHRRGRINRGRPNVFAGLLKDALGGGSYHVTLRVEKGDRRHHVLVSHGYTEGRGAARSFPFDVFEQALLSLLREIDPHEILNGDEGPDESLALAGQLAGVEGSIALIVQEMDKHGESPTLFARLRQKEAQKADLAARLAKAKQKAAHPLSASWGEAHAFLRALEEAPDPQEARMRLRAALRDIVELIWLLVVPRGRDRLCAVQVWFTGGKRHRDYLIMHRPPKANGSGRVDGTWWARSFSSTAAPDALDLRVAAHVAELEKDLMAVSLS
jgi:DNA invertase Pin-like site-specific DNA recombinase